MTLSPRAFTLIETVIVTALSTLMLLMIGFLVYAFNKTAGYEHASSQSSGSASAILREVEALAFPARAVVVSHAFASATYASDSANLVLEIPSIDSSGVVIASTYDYAAFYLVGTNVYRLLEANGASSRDSGTKLLSTTVNTLTFSYNNADFSQVNTVTIDVQTQAPVPQYSLTLTDHRHEQVRLRNH